MSDLPELRTRSALVCPGLFYGVTAADGLLLRVRVPGGRLNYEQGQGLVQLIEHFGAERIQITNRANIQFRGIHQVPEQMVLQYLQGLGLAAQNPAVDSLRNLMISPVSGLEGSELFDFSPWLPQLEHFFETYPVLAQLPAKFSIGLDGGSKCSIGQRSEHLAEHRYNEIQLTAIEIEQDYLPGLAAGIYLQLTFGIDKTCIPTRVLVTPEQGLPLIKSLIWAYLDYCQAPNCPPKARLRNIITDWGVEKFLNQARHYLDFPLPRFAEIPPLPTHPGRQYLGIHPQSQPEHCYIGIGLTQGQISGSQLRGLVDLAADYGTGELRLTPWHAIVLINIPARHIPAVITALAHLGLSPQSPHTPEIVACSGTPGCLAAQTNTPDHAQKLAVYLDGLCVEQPLSIHLTACPKACAHPSPANITLLGIEGETYRLYLGDFRHDPAPVVAERPFPELLPLIRSILIPTSGPGQASKS